MFTVSLDIDSSIQSMWSLILNICTKLRVNISKLIVHSLFLFRHGFVLKVNTSHVGGWRAPAAAARVVVAATGPAQKRAFAALTRDEIAEDFAAIHDNRPPRRPPIRISILPRTRKCIYNHVSMPLLLVGSTNSMLGWRLGKSCWLEIREILLSLRIMALLWLLIRCLWKCQACLSWLQYIACVLQMP